jgi:hypothetical protein
LGTLILLVTWMYVYECWISLDLAPVLNWRMESSNQISFEVMNGEKFEVAPTNLKN